jgi:hypothetical protein
VNRSDELDRLRAVLGVHLKTTRVAGAPTPECLDDDTVSALAGGTLDAAGRDAVLSHLAVCPRCLRAVASVARALADEPAAGAGRRRIFYRLALPLAAAAGLVLVFASQRGTVDEAQRHRAPTNTAGAVPAPLAPLGVVADAGALRWSAVAGADRYRVTLFDTQSRVVYETQLADTAAVLPDSIVLVRGQRYLWKVEARTGWDRWSASELVEFRVAQGAHP